MLEKDDVYDARDMNIKWLDRCCWLRAKNGLL